MFHTPQKIKSKMSSPSDDRFMFIPRYKVLHYSSLLKLQDVLSILTKDRKNRECKAEFMSITKKYCHQNNLE